MMHGDLFVCGKLITSHRKCGKAGCWCAKEAQGHESTYLSAKVGRKWKMIYVPRNKLKMVRGWVKKHKEICEKMIRISNACIEKIKG